MTSHRDTTDTDFDNHLNSLSAGTIDAKIGSWGVVSNEIDSELLDFKKEYDEKVLSPIQDLGFEKKYNHFLRIDEISFLDYLKDENLFTNEDIITRFKLLRVLRDEW